MFEVGVPAHVLAAFGFLEKPQAPILTPVPADPQKNTHPHPSSPECEVEPLYYEVLYSLQHR